MNATQRLVLAVALLVLNIRIATAGGDFLWAFFASVGAASSIWMGYAAVRDMRVAG